MKRFLLSLLTVALVAALVAFVLLPTAVRQYRLRDNAAATADYRAAANELSLLDCGTMLAQAHDHNQSLERAAWTDPYAPEAAQPDSASGNGPYSALLDPAGNGVMAVLEMPKLGVSLAVYHGDAGDASPARVEHAPLSRLPADDAEGPCILRADRERFFDPYADLGRLIVGDCFFLNVLQETITYEVFQVAVLPPQALDGLEALEDSDECALVARVNAGNSDNRLVVRGRRVPRQSARPLDDSRALPSGTPALIFGAPLAAAGLALLAVIEGLRRAVRRHRRRRMKL